MPGYPTSPSIFIRAARHEMLNEINRRQVQPGCSAGFSGHWKKLNDNDRRVFNRARTSTLRRQHAERQHLFWTQSVDLVELYRRPSAA